MSFEIKKATRYKPVKIEIPIGQRFNRLVTISFLGSINGHRMWKCLCDCGNSISIRGSALIAAADKISCGCQHKEKLLKACTKHGMHKSHTWAAWHAMKARCRATKGKSYQNYVLRGIGFCDRWQKFENFLNDMGERPPGTELDRRNNNLGYSKDNCRWVTRDANQRNKRNTRLVEYDGLSQCAKDWASQLGLHYATLLYRLNSGWPIEDALMTPGRQG